jgi:hypothetical protein
MLADGLSIAGDGNSTHCDESHPVKHIKQSNRASEIDRKLSLVDDRENFVDYPLSFGQVRLKLLVIS